MTVNLNTKPDSTNSHTPPQLYAKQTMTMGRREREEKNPRILNIDHLLVGIASYSIYVWQGPIQARLAWERKKNLWRMLVRRLAVPGRAW